VSDQIRDPAVSMLASAVSARAPVREFLLQLQRRLGASKRVVVEGRDMGTVVFPQADVKFYLDADLQIRARRRHDELALKTTPPPSLASVENEMQRRDRNDSSRSLAPLRPADDAIRIDSTHLDAQGVVELMSAHIARHQAK
jgi:CMP/dCMP kinase